MLEFQTTLQWYIEYVLSAVGNKGNTNIEFCQNELIKHI